VQIDTALEIDPDDSTLATARALILMRLGRYEESATIYEDVISRIAEKPRRWRLPTLDQAAECYRRWAEMDKQQRDPAKQMTHLERSREILDLALANKDFDSRTGSAYTNVVEDAIFAALNLRDREAVIRWLSVLIDARHVINCPPFRILSLDRLPETFPKDEELLEKIKHLPGMQNESMRVALDAGSAKPSGVIKSILTQEKFGFITDSRGRDWFFHATFLADPREWEELEAGRKVEFEMGSNNKGPCAVEVKLL